MPYSKTSDFALISLLREGKHEAVNEIFRRYWQPLYLTAFYKLRSHELAEETVQSLFSELWDKKDRLLSQSLEVVNLSAYLTRAVQNKILNHVRQQVHNKRYCEYCKRHLPSSASNAHELAEYNELNEKLNAAIDQLSDKTKKIFVLHKLKGIPVVQISRQLKLSEKAIGYHLTKSVKELRVHLRDFF